MGSITTDNDRNICISGIGIWIGHGLLLNRDEAKALRELLNEFNELLHKEEKGK